MLTPGVRFRVLAIVIAATGLVSCASENAPTPGTEPEDTTETTVPADDGTTTTHELEQLPALDEDSAM